MADLLRFRQLEWRISGHASLKDASPGEGASRGVRRAGARRSSLRSAPPLVGRALRASRRALHRPPGRPSPANGLLDPWKIRPKDPSSRPLRLWALGSAFDLLSAGSVARATSTFCCAFGAFFRFSRLHKSFIIFRCLKSHGATHGNGCSLHHPNSNMKSPVQPESENSGTIKPTPDVSSIVDQTVHHVGEDGPSTAACPVEPDPQSLIPQTVIITEAPSESAKP